MALVEIKRSFPKNKCQFQFRYLSFAVKKHAKERDSFLKLLEK